MHALLGVANEQIAIMSEDGAKSITYDELSRQSARGAASLAALGVRRGDVVGLHLPNTPEFAIALLAVLRLGAVAAPCAVTAPEDELAAMFSLTQPSVIITTGSVKSVVVAAAARVGSGRVVDSLPDPGTATHTDVIVSPEAPAIVAFSSGTSGLPKAVVLTHGGLISSLRMASVALPLMADDVLLALAPFAHVMGLWGHLLRGLVRGCTVVTMDRFDPAAFLLALSSHRVTQMIVPPSLIDFLANSNAVDDHDLAALRVIYVGGAGASAERERACASRLGCVVAQGYGMTEAGPMIAVNPVTDAGSIRHGSAGLPLPEVQVRIVDPQRHTVLEGNESGEIWVKSPALMAGYLGDQAATSTTIDPDGWLRTGDIGQMDSEGYLWLTDRIKHLIKGNGHQVAPAELEDVLRRHPAVVDAVVIGLPHTRKGEVPVGFVTIHSPAQRETLLSFVADRVSTAKRLHSVHIVDDFPRSHSGKILRRKLHEYLLTEEPASTPQRRCTP